jgi:uncharacterized membrane protein (UPF0127 family)
MSMTTRCIARIALLALACVWAAVPLQAALGDDDTIPLSAFPRERIAIQTRSSFRQPMFDAWRADNARTREQGLMFVTDSEMGPDQAMIFVYDSPQYVSMWMKNTLLSLDMLFADANGCVVTIKERAQPGSLAEIRSGKRATLVVELKAGTVATHGIRVGDRVLRLDASPAAADGITCAPGPATR